MYDAITALHYSAYRPPLHSIILGRALQQNKTREIGLDIGCGTGRSARELANFSDHVVGLEPSKSMLYKSEKHKKVNYVNSPAELIPIAARSVDVVTLAGSLNYIERSPLVNELVRICRSEAEIVVYDFESDLSSFDEFLGIDLTNPSPGYDHSTNLSEHSSFDEVAIVEDEFSTNTSPLEIAHLLLSSRERHNALCEKYNNSDPLNLIEAEISSMPKNVPLQSKIFYSIYSLSAHQISRMRHGSGSQYDHDQTGPQTR